MMKSIITIKQGLYGKLEASTHMIIKELKELKELHQQKLIRLFGNDTCGWLKTSSYDYI